jgi:hypothetical protein
MRPYFVGCAAAIRISTSLGALCCQSGLVATLATPTIAHECAKRVMNCAWDPSNTFVGGADQSDVMVSANVRAAAGSFSTSDR